MLTTYRPEKYKLMSLNLMELDFFREVYETRSLTATAKHFGVSLSTASRTLKKLRETLDDPLFVRTQPLLIPTPKADGLIEPVKTLLSQTDHFLELKAFRPIEMVRQIRIGAVDNALYCVLRPFIEAFVREAPHASIDFVPLDRPLWDMLENGELDGAICPTVIPMSPNCESLTLFPVTYALCMRKDHPLALQYRAGKPFTRADLANFKKVSLSNASIPAHQIFSLDERNYCGEAWQEVGMTVPYFLAVPAVLSVTDYTCVMPTQTAKILQAEMHGNVEMMVFQLPTKSPTSPDFSGYFTRFVWHKRMNGDPAMEWMRGLLAHYVKTPEPDPIGWLGEVNHTNEYFLPWNSEG